MSDNTISINENDFRSALQNLDTMRSEISVKPIELDPVTSEADTLKEYLIRYKNVVGVLERYKIFCGKDTTSLNNILESELKLDRTLSEAYIIFGR